MNVSARCNGRLLKSVMSLIVASSVVLSGCQATPPAPPVPAAQAATPTPVPAATAATAATAAKYSECRTGATIVPRSQEGQSPWYWRFVLNWMLVEGDKYVGCLELRDMNNSAAVDPVYAIPIDCRLTDGRPIKHFLTTRPITSTQAQTSTVPVAVVWLNGTVTCPNISLSDLINGYQNSQSKPTVEENKVFSHTFFSMSYYGLPVTKTVPGNVVPTPPSDVLPLPTNGPRYYGPHVAIAQGDLNLLVGLGPPANSITLTLDPGCGTAVPGCDPVRLTAAATPISSTQIYQRMSFSIGTSAVASYTFDVPANEYIGTYMGLRDDKAIAGDAPCPSLKHCILLATYLPGDRAAEQMLKHDPPIQLMGKSMTLTITAFNSILGDVVIDPRGGSLP